MSELEQEVYDRLTRNFNMMDCLVKAINGMPEHVHILMQLPPTHSISVAVGWVKGEASHWFNEKYLPDHTLFWQKGYSAFSVSRANLTKVEAYIQNQKVIHQNRTFEEEINMFRNEDFDNGQY